MLLALLGCAAPGPTPGDDVVLVTLDTVRADALGAYGGTVPTPNLDRIAREGIRFDRAFTVTPLTIPAHASIHTGLWPPRHGVRDNGELYLSDGADTLAERLHAKGYATMASVGAEVTSRRWGFAQGFDAFFDLGGRAATSTHRWEVERRADAVVRDAKAWLGPRQGGPAPIFAWVHLYDAHDPYRPPEPWATKYAADPYAGEVAWVDSQVGELLAGLKLDRTWVVVVADHGESRGEHGEATHGVLLYEGATRVPFLVRPPDGRAWDGRRGTVVDAPVSLVDVLPTVLAAVGVPVEASAVDGRDLLPVLKGEPAEADRPVYAESLYAWRHFGWAPQEALYTSAYSLLASTTPELYAANDHAQATDLSSDTAALTTMQSRLATLVATMTPLLSPSHASGSAERTAALEALGYLTHESASGRDATGAPLPGLPDPVRRLPMLARVDEARAAYRAGDFAKAKAAAEAAVAEDPGLVETRVLLATILWRTGDAERAWAEVSAADADRPGAMTRHLMGLMRLAAGDSDEGVRLLTDAAERDPYDAAITETLLQTLLVREDLPTLAEAAAKARKNLPDSPIVAGMLGVSEALAGHAQAALPLLDEAIRGAPDQPFVHYALGLARRDTGDREGARAAFQEEIQRFPPATAARRELDALP